MARFLFVIVLTAGPLPAVGYIKLDYNNCPCYYRVLDEINREVP